MATFLEERDDPADVLIHFGDQSEIDRTQRLDVFIRWLQIRKTYNVPCGCAGVLGWFHKRMIGGLGGRIGKARWFWDRRRIVHLVKWKGCNQRRMRANIGQMRKPVLVGMGRHRGKKPVRQKRSVAVFGAVDSRIIDPGRFAMRCRWFEHVPVGLKFVALVHQVRAPRVGHFETHFDGLVKSDHRIFIAAHRRIIVIMDARILRCVGIAE